MLHAKFLVCLLLLPLVFGLNKIIAILLATQSDPRSENNGIANCHTTLHHCLNPSLAGTLQHCWMNKNKNIKSKVLWSDFCQNCTPGFEDIMNAGVNEGLYHVKDPLERFVFPMWNKSNKYYHRLVFHWIAILYLQFEMDLWVESRNETPKQVDKHKILPHGIPNLIHAKPECFNAKNFMVCFSTPRCLMLTLYRCMSRMNLSMRLCGNGHILMIPFFT